MRESCILEYKAVEIFEWVTSTVDSSLELPTVTLGRERPSGPDRTGRNDRVGNVQQGVHRDGTCCGTVRIVLIIDSNEV
jgi:hypothetical protein